MTMRKENHRQPVAFIGNCTTGISICPHAMYKRVPLLPASTGTMTTELLWLCSPGVRNQQCPVVGNELLLELQRAVRVEVLGVVGNDCLSNRLTDSVDLGGVSTTLDADADVDGTESILASYQNRLIDLESEDLRLEEADGGAVDVEETTALLGVGDRGGGLTSWSMSGCVRSRRSTSRSATYLLFAESLNGLCC